MIVYHGSTEIVKVPRYGLGSDKNDYGRGFYCTESSELAREWACPTIKNGFANRYELDLSGLNVLYLNSDGYNILNWIALLIQNRIFPKRSPVSRQTSQYLLSEFLPDTSGYDVICGYRADDSYYSYARDFLNNTISVNRLSQAMKLGELGEQIVLMSEKAFGSIQFVGYEIADGSIYSSRRAEREERAKRAYLSNHGADLAISPADLYALDLLREQVKNDDPRLEAVSMGCNGGYAGGFFDCQGASTQEYWRYFKEMQRRQAEKDPHRHRFTPIGTASYDEIYLEDAMDTLGGAVEYAVLIAGMDGQEFIDLFIASDLASEFGRGNVKFISGMSGIELCREVLQKCGLALPAATEIAHIHYPAEYWVGWILAYYQWHTGKPFQTICKKLKYQDLVNLYGVLHEADPSKAVSVFNSMMEGRGETNLAVLRKHRGFSQSELARAAGISIRSIQLYEQRKTDINNAQHNHLKAIAAALGCAIDDLTE